jgi:hypothetical protein
MDRSCHDAERQLQQRQGHGSGSSRSSSGSSGSSRKAHCGGAIALVQWWATLPPEAYEKISQPPCREDLCAKCCGAAA